MWRSSVSLYTFAPSIFHSGKEHGQACGSYDMKTFTQSNFISFHTYNAEEHSTCRQEAMQDAALVNHSRLGCAGES